MSDETEAQHGPSPEGRVQVDPRPTRLLAEALTSRTVRRVRRD